MAITLTEVAKAQQNEMVKKYVNVLATEFPIQTLLGVDTITGFRKPVTIMSTLPTVNPRAINAAFTASNAAHDTYDIYWKNYGGDFSIDTALQAGDPAHAGKQSLAFVQAIAKQVAKQTFEGTGTDQMVGIKDYLTAFFAGQIINAGTTASGDLLTVAMLEDLVDKVAGGNRAIFLSKKVRQRLNALLRATSSLSEGRDQFGVPVTFFNQIPVYIMEDNNDGTDVLSITEIDGAATNSDTSSVYCLNLDENGVRAFGPDSGLINAKTISNVTNADISNFELFYAISLDQQRAAARLRYVKQAVA